MITVRKSNSRLKSTAVLLCLFVAVQGCKSTRRSAPASAPAQRGSNPRDTIIAKISAQGERLPDSDFAREIFAEKFDPRTHMDLPDDDKDPVTESSDSSYALAEPVTVGVLTGVRVITAFNGQIQSFYAAEKLGIDFLSLTRKVKVGKDLYALYWLESGSAATSTAGGVTAGTVAGGAVVVAGVAVIGYLIYDIRKNSKVAEELGKKLSEKEKKDIWDGTNSYWGNFCRIYGIGC